MYARACRRIVRAKSLDRWVAACSRAGFTLAVLLAAAGTTAGRAAAEAKPAAAPETLTPIAFIQALLGIALQTIALLTIIALLVVFVRWSMRQRSGLTILPFEVTGSEVKCYGQAIANALAYDLDRIDQMSRNVLFRSTNLEKPLPPTQRPTQQVRTATIQGPVSGGARIPALQLAGDAGAQIPDISFELGGSKFSLGGALQSLQRLWIRREPQVVVLGSLQTLGSDIRLIAILNKFGQRPWRSADPGSRSVVCSVAATVENEGQVLEHVRDLAFQIYFELTDDASRPTRTWQGLKFRCDAIASYGEYSTEPSPDLLRKMCAYALAAVRAEPANRTFFDLLYGLGGTASKSGAYEYATRMLDSAIELLGKNMADDGDRRKEDVNNLADAYNALGMCHLSLGDYPRAEVAFRKAFINNRELLDAYANLGWLYKLEGRDDEVRDLVSKAPVEFLEQTSPDDLAAWYLSLDYPAKALNILREQEAAHLRLQFIQTLESCGQRGEAIKECRNLINALDGSDPSLASLYNQLGTLLAESNSTDEALQAYQRAIALDPDDASPHNNLALLYADDQPEKAIVEFKRAVALDPELTVAHMNLAYHYKAMKMDEFAIVQLERVVHLFPEEVSAQFELGIAYDEQERTDDALDHLKHAVQLQPGNPYARDYLAYIYAKKGLLEEAVSETKRVIENIPENLRAQGFLAHLYRKLGRASEFDAQVKVAQRLKAEAIRRRPDTPPFADAYYEACFDALCGNTEGALKNLKEALTKHIKSPIYAQRDMDFEFISSDPRFQKLISDQLAQDESDNGGVATQEN